MKRYGSYRTLVVWGLLLVSLFTLAACGDAMTNSTGNVTTTGTKTGKPMIPVVVATATTEHALGLPLPPEATATDAAGGRMLLGELFASPYQPVEQDVYTTRQALATLKAFYTTALAGAGYQPEVTWSDLGVGSSGASWAKGETQVRVILVEKVEADRATSLNTTYHLTAQPIQGGDNLIYVIGLDRSKLLK